MNELNSTEKRILTLLLCPAHILAIIITWLLFFLIAESQTTLEIGREVRFLNNSLSHLEMTMTGYACAFLFFCVVYAAILMPIVVYLIVSSYLKRKGVENFRFQYGWYITLNTTDWSGSASPNFTSRYKLFADSMIGRSYFVTGLLHIIYNFRYIGASMWNITGSDLANYAISAVVYFVAWPFFELRYIGSLFGFRVL